MVFSINTKLNIDNVDETSTPSSTNDAITPTHDVNSKGEEEEEDDEVLVTRQLLNNSVHFNNLNLVSPLLCNDVAIESTATNDHMNVDEDNDYDCLENEKNFEKDLNQNVNLANNIYFGEDISVIETLITPVDIEIDEFDGNSHKPHNNYLTSSSPTHTFINNSKDDYNNKENGQSEATGLDLTKCRRKSVENLKKTLCSNNESQLSLWNWFSLNASTIEDIEMNIFHNLSDEIKREYVYIRNNSMKIWTVVTNEQTKTIPIVLVHGYCGGVALWAHNFDNLSKTHPIYAFDLIGFGRSSRPAFSPDSIVSEMQFVESIEDWRKQLGIEKMILLGHSLGGFLISSYAIKYPQHTKALILIDPWGFQENANKNRVDTPTPMWVKFITNVSRYVSPLSVFRATGSVGVSMFKYLRPDFKKKYMSVLGNNDLIYDYLYHLNKQNPSGEEGFKAISEQYGFAKNPMIKRIQKINPNIPIWFIYGSRSWIDSTPGFNVKYIRNRFAYVSVKIIPGAGHHVYADKPESFNDYVNEIIDLIDLHDETNENYSPNNYSSESIMNSSN